jgi:hypothetical protein
MAKECEFCGYQEANGLYRLTYSLDPQKERYIPCGNCLFALVTCSLSPQQFLRAKEKGNDTSRFFLHDAYYDPETGQASNLGGKWRKRTLRRCRKLEEARGGGDSGETRPGEGA